MEKTLPNQTDLSIYDNSWYNPGPYWKRLLWMTTGQLLLNIQFPLPSALKRIILRIFGAKIGKGVVIKPSVNIKYPWFLEIGDFSWIGEKVWIDNLVMVSISSHCCVSQGAYLLTGNHNFTKKTFDLLVKPITLKEGAWIGARAIVGPGVTCHSHSILTVNSFTSKDLEEYGIYQGNPAIKIKNRIIDR
jgi:putative colanic acid biosynthesis acetyltransferase WcaF